MNPDTSTKALASGDIHAAPVRNLEPPVRPQVSGGGGCAWWVWLLFLGAAGAIAYFGYWAWEYQKAKGATTRPTSRSTSVAVDKAVKGDLNLYLEEIGTVTPLETVTVRSRVDGQLMKIDFTEGQLIQEGGLLAEIDPRPFQVQLEQAQAQMAHDQASLANAQADLKRFKDAPETVTKQQIDTQAAVVLQDQAVIKTDDALINSAKLQLTYCRITAPITGQVGLRTVDQGNIVHASDEGGIVGITRVQPISVVFNIIQNEIGRVARAMGAVGGGKKLVVDCYDEDDSQKLATGVLTALDNQVDPTTGTVRLKAQFDNKDGALFPNEFVRAHLLVESLRGVVIIPTVARQIGPPPNDNFVYVVKGDDTVELRNIKVGPVEGDQTVVTEGLKAGEIVVIDGVDKLVPGAKVTLRMEGNASTTQPTTRGSRTGGGKGAGNRRAATREAAE
ncbi:MAG TPA: efflux RND transporter periplasmic adaptor subunit [Tepidisphaeraceae bacterium]|jgi:multidrug efflux system membrane fusion protein|nr:efflux RND transporter periplasmic adaptor subunit [Tepidisphaeraceae bacterium]